MFRVSARLCCAAAAAVLSAIPALGQTTITQWNFNSGADANTSTGTLTPSTGTGSASTFGGIAVSFSSGDATGGSTDPNIGDDSAWQTTTYPAQGVGSGAAGVEFAVSTTGFTNIILSYDHRHSNTSSRFLQVQVSTDGTSFAAFGAPFEASLGGDVWYNGRTLDLSSLPAANNNASFKFRLAPVFVPSTSAYTASTTTSTYAGTGTNRYDMVTVAGTPVASIAPTGNGGAFPGAVCFGGGQILLTITVQPGINPASTTLTVAADLTPVGGGASAAFFDNATNGDATAGDNIFSLLYTVPGAVNTGAKTVTATIGDQIPGRTSTAPINFTVADCSIPSASRVVISQIYGGGGNLGPPAGAFNADFIELYNRSATTVDVTGWSVQYAPPNTAAGFDSLGDRVILSGDIRPGQYLLVRFSDPGTIGSPLPQADFSTQTGLGGIGSNAGRVALVRAVGLIGTNCNDTNIEDFVGFGGTICFEGAASTSPTANDVAAIRKLAGAQDTNQNFNDFAVATPTPRNRTTGGFLAGYGSLDQTTVCAGTTVSISVSVTGATTPASTGVQVRADLSQVGGSATQSLTDNGGGNFSLTHLVPASVIQGVKTIAVTTSDAQLRTDVSALSLSVANCTNSASRVVISQVFGGGGNVGSVFNADIIELFNRSASSVDLTGWSVQYASATGEFLLSGRVSLSGSIGPGEYRLVRTNAESAVNGLPVPPADFTPTTLFGLDNQFAKVALVRMSSLLAGNCITPDVEDFLGYGSAASCFEGVSTTATLSNTLAATRKDDGCRDGDQNGIDFDVVTPSALPRNSSSPANPCAVAANGACCAGATCSVTAQVACAGANTSFAGISTVCNAPGNNLTPCCKADYNHSGSITVQDIFDFLSGYFSGAAAADINGGGVSVQDIFDYLSAYFAAGC